MLFLNSETSQDNYYHTAIDAIPDCPMIHLNKPATKPETTDQTHKSAEKVGCIFIANNLHKYLGKHSQLSHNKAFLDVYHMLTLLDHYLHDNPGQHNHCMSDNTKYVTLLKHAI